MTIKITLTDRVPLDNIIVNKSNSGATEITLNNIDVKRSTLIQFDCRSDNGVLLDYGFIDLTRNGTIKLQRIQ